MATVALAAATTPVAACSTSGTAYGQAVAETWRPFATGQASERRALQHELIRYATLAPSSHNTQCWNFKLETHRVSYPISRGVARSSTRAITISSSALAARRRTLLSPVSLTGCAATLPSTRLPGPPCASISSRRKPSRQPLFDAIPMRQCTRAAYDGQPLEPAQLRQLETAASGRGVQLLLLTARAQVEQVLNYVVEGNSAQLNDPAFMKELLQWIRFSDGEAVAKRDGLFSRASGSPSVPRWLAAPLFKLLFTPKGDNENYSKFIRSSAGIAVFVSDASDREYWVETGRCYERFVLQATAMGVRTAMLNQPVEVASVRPQFAAAIGIGKRRPDLVVRFGHGPEMPRSLRRSVDAVIVA
jgi:hypothetical protein